MPARKKTSSDSIANFGFEADFGLEHADTFRRNLRAAYVLTNFMPSSKATALQQAG